MPSRNFNRSSVGLYQKTILGESLSSTWYHSPRVNGKIKLRANPSARTRVRQIAFRPINSSPGSWSYTPGTPAVNPTIQLKSVMDQLEAETYARLRGRLYKGSAALGVTLASWKQSREMIVDRYRQLSLQSDRFEVKARRIIETQHAGPRERVRRISLKNLSSQYLEMVFGWQPLLSDIHAAATSVIHTQPKAQFIRASAMDYTSREKERGNSAVSVVDYVQGTVRCTRAVAVEISNPNLWLRERAGLNNPAAVAWDLVPWSFVVNMFANTGQLVNSITDFAGLTFTNGSIVRAYDLTISTAVKQKIAYNPPVGGYSAFAWDQKHTSLDGISRPPLVFKLPEVNWELAGIAASLFFQKFRRLDGLMSFTQLK